jgi:hypothetical protein
VNQATGDWQQITNMNNKPQLVTLGPATNARCLREFIDNRMASSKLTTTLHISKAPNNTELLEQCRAHRTALDQIATVRATMFSRSKAHSTR